MLLTGCFPSQGTYDYEHIRQEFAQTDEVTNNDRKVSKKRNKEKKTELRETLTLEKAIDLALKNNPDVARSRASLKKAQAILAEANSAFWPSLSFYTEYLQGDCPSSFWFKHIDQREVDPDDMNDPDDFNDPGWFENYETGIQGKLNLFRGGRDVLNKKIAKKRKKISQLEKIQVINQLKSSVINAFYNTKAAKDLINITQRSIRIVKKDLEQTRIRYKAGGALKSDLLSMQVRLSMAQEDLVKAKNRYKRSLSTLSNLLGYNAAKDFRLAESKELDLITELPDSYQEAVDYALMHRPESKKIHQRVIKRAIALDKAKSYYMPNVNVLGKYYHDDPNLSFDQNRENWTIGIRLDWDLFSGLSRQARIKQAESSIQEMFAQDKKTAQAIQLEVKKALLQLKEAKSRQEVARKSVKQAKESLRLVRRQYKGGSSTITRYLNAELDLKRSQYRYSLAFFARQKALADLARALGYWGHGAFD